MNCRSRYVVVVLAIVGTLTIGCETPEGIPNGDPPPGAIFHTAPRLSVDGGRLAYVDRRPGAGILHILDLRSGTNRTVNVAGLLPPSVIHCDVQYGLWCPYDPARILVHCVTLTVDTVKGSIATHYGQNTYVVSVDRDSLWRVTPSRYGPNGSDAGFGVLAWLYGSNARIDSFHQGGAGIYIPQQDTFVHVDDTTFRLQNNDGRHVFGAMSAIDQITTTLDGRPLGSAVPEPLRHPIMIPGVAWSPNGDNLLVVLDHGTGRNDLWLLDVGEYERRHLTEIPTRQIQLANTPEKAVGYSIDFTSDSTFAVPLTFLRDGKNYTMLWEASTSGRLVRQLTFNP